MTDEQINTAIAEHCGWTVRGSVIGYMEPDGNGELEFIPTIGDLPDYCNDLNAMHEVEVKYILVDGDLTADYWNNLYDTTESTLWPFASTALQRAEAFLKTINKWEDS